MNIIKSRDDLSQIPPEDPAYSIMDNLVRCLIDDYPPYDPEADGFLCLCESATNDFTRPLTEIWPDGATLLDMKHYWESVVLENGFYQPCWLRDNQYGVLLLVPDCPELPEAVREALEYHMDP